MPASFVRSQQEQKSGGDFARKRRVCLIGGHHDFAIVAGPV
jgi:hypothetical protein